MPDTLKAREMMKFGEPLKKYQPLGIAQVTVRWHLAAARKQLAVLLGEGEKA